MTNIHALPEWRPKAECVLARYKANSEACSTRRSYAWAWKDYLKWARENGQKTTLPLEPHAIALWLAQCAAEGLGVGTLGVMRSAIATAHRNGGFENPCKDPEVKQALAGIKRTKKVRPYRVRALEGFQVAQMVRACTDEYRKCLRDRAILLIGYSGAYRRSELVSLLKNDCVFNAQGVRILLRVSKTDQEGEGREVFIRRLKKKPEVCPVRALELWLKVCPHNQPRVFPFSSMTIVRVIKKWALEIGLDPKEVAGHSLRAGYVTTGLRRGRSKRAIKAVTGHSSDKMLDIYDRPENEK